MKERANAALARIQRNAYAMGILRSRLESRISLILNQNGKTDGYSDLTRVLELVKNGELVLHEISEKIESARFLEEFTVIMDSAASSVSEIKDDLERMVPEAEAALEKMHEAISNVSTGLPTELRHEIEPGILAEVSAAIAAGKPSVSVAEVSATLPEEKEEEEPERVPA
jgi:hypothetical protein